jgi:molybdopterin/thiamine biosynthesis adenylyltransferase/rhodanese-related sulfurtransferase
MSNTDYFSKEELARYNRHIIIPGFGMEAQLKLKNSRVLVVGAGGLGSPVLLYLAAAGVGHIGIVDCDVVEDSNLQRQVLFGIDEIGISKTEAAKKRLESLNPYIKIKVYNTQFTSKNAIDIAAEYDVIADGTDNFPTRYLVNDACVLLNKPNVYASIYQFEGNVSVFNHTVNGLRGPNYRDLFPVPPAPGTVANCSEAGVLGVLPGIIGSMQALEIIKVITNIGETLSGKFYTFDALTFESRTFNINKDPENPLNGKNPSIKELVDYEQFCGMKAIEKSVKKVSAEEFFDMQSRDVDLVVIDVREAYEHEIVSIPGILVPLSTLKANVHRIPLNRKVIVLCKSGIRSAKAIRILEDEFGYNNLYNLEGGLVNYINELELDLPVY